MAENGLKLVGKDPDGIAKAISVNDDGVLLVELLGSIVEESAARNRGLYPTSKVELLDLPQIDGMDTSGGTHPSVLWFHNKWNGWHYWMAYTPYPGISNEWPCILVSNDGVNWQEPEGIANPIDKDDVSSDYFPDPELVYMESQGKLRCYYLTEHSRFSFKESSDGVNWDGQRTDCTGVDYGVSPSIVKKAYNNWELWINTGDKLDRYISEDGVNWSLAGKTTSNLDGVGVIWHHEVRYMQSGYHLLASIGKIETATSSKNTDLHYGFSIDGIRWYIDPVPLLSREKDLYDLRVYKASLVPFGDEWLIYTSGNTASANPTERIGLMKGKLNLSVDLYKFVEPSKTFKSELIPLQKLKAPAGDLSGSYVLSVVRLFPPKGAYSAKIIIIVRSWQGVPRDDGLYGIETHQTGIENIIGSAHTFVSVEGFKLSGGTNVPGIMEINFHPMSPEEDDINDSLFLDNVYAKIPFIFNGDGESERVRLRIRQLGIYLRQGDWRIDVGETPEPGDLVTVTVNGTGHVFTCVATNPGEDEYTNAEELKGLINALTDVAASQYDNVISIGSVKTVSVSISGEEGSSMKEPVEITEDEGVELEAHVLWFYK